MDNELIYELWLLSAFGTASRNLQKLIKLHHTAQGVYENINKFDCFLKPDEKTRSFTSTLETAKRLVEYCNINKVHIITVNDDKYPALLREIPYPPRLLFVQGNVAALNSDIPICVVGTRKPSDYSVRVAATLCDEMARAGVTLISGFARGIDEVAHNAAVKAGVPTVAVLACGISIDYPSGSVKRREEIIGTGGAIITELMPAEKSTGSYFRIRNRIMSGLAKGVLLVQVGMVSGCHLTAGHADDQNRDIFCIPPCDIFDERYTGIVRYLRDGAVPVFGAEDIVVRYTDFNFEDRKKTENKAKTDNKEKNSGSGNNKSNGKNSEKNNNIANIGNTKTAPDISGYSDDCKKIIELLKNGKIYAEVIVTDKTIADAYLALIELEAEGVIKNMPGGYYELA